MSPSQNHMDASNGRVGESFARADIIFPSRFEETVIVLLQVGSFDLQELFRAEVLQDMVLDITVVPRISTRAEDRLFVFLHPPPEPLTERD